MTHARSPSFPLYFKDNNYSSEDELLENTKPNLISFSLSSSSSNGSGILCSASEKTSEEERHIQNKLYSIRSLGVGFTVPNTARKQTSTNGGYETCRENNSLRLDESNSIRCMRFNTGSCAPELKSELSFCRSRSFQYGYNRPVTSNEFDRLCQSQQNLECVLPCGLSLNSISFMDSCKSSLRAQSRRCYLKQIASDENKPPTQKVVSNEIDVRSFLGLTWGSYSMSGVIERLHRTLQEQDTVLHEIKSNYLSLLLENAEAKNKIDQLRFSSLGPQCEVKSVQTEINRNCWSSPCDSPETSQNLNHQLLFSSTGSQIKVTPVNTSNIMNAQENTISKNYHSTGANLYVDVTPQLYNEFSRQRNREIIPKHSIHLLLKNCFHLTLSNLQLHALESTRESLHHLEDCKPCHCIVPLQTDCGEPLDESNMLMLLKGSMSLHCAIEKVTFWCTALPSTASLGSNFFIYNFPENGVSCDDPANFEEIKPNMYRMLIKCLKKNKEFAWDVPKIMKSMYDNIQLCQATHPFVHFETDDTSTQYKSIEINENRNSWKSCGTCMFHNRSFGLYHNRECSCKITRQSISCAEIRRNSHFHSSYHSAHLKILSGVVQYINYITNRAEATKKESYAIHNFLKTQHRTLL